MKVYLIVGSELHDNMVAVMQNHGFEIIGHEFTMDAAIISLKKAPLSPDLFIINGLAQASGAVEGVVNRNRSLLFKLKEIRVAAPNSRILLILPSDNPPELIKNIVSLGIYDIRQTSRFDQPQLLDWIGNPLSIADFTGFKTGQVPDIGQGEVLYGDDRKEGPAKDLIKRTLEGLNAGKDLVSRITAIIEGGGDAPAGNGEMNEMEIERGALKIERNRSGRPLSLLGLGDTRIEEWIRENFSDQMDVHTCSSDSGVIKQKTAELSPDILIIMRHSLWGGTPDAVNLAVWAADHVPAVLFIVGELDGPGREMIEKAAKAGVRHMISCEKGGYISGDEFVFVLSSIIREIKNAEMQPPGKEAFISRDVIEQKKKDNAKRGYGIFRGSSGRPSGSGRKRDPGDKKPGLDKYRGVPLEEGLQIQYEFKSQKNPTSLVEGGILAVVSPWRPNLAGRLAAQAVKILSEVEGGKVAYIGANGNSTGAVWLDVSDEELMMSDWRVPGSRFPIELENIRIYAVDPNKNLVPSEESGFWDIVKQARKASTFTVVDFAGDISAAEKAAHQGRAVVLVVLPGGDPVELKISLLWLRNFNEGKKNIVTGIDLRGSAQGIPEGLKPKVVIRNNPSDALSMALKKTGDDEFAWN